VTSSPWRGPTHTTTIPAPATGAAILASIRETPIPTTDPTADATALRAELARVRDAPTVRRHADGSISVDWAPGQASCLITRDLLDGLLLERATLRDQIDELRRLLGDVQRNAPDSPRGY
jgi:hypothetical protein